MGALTDRVNKTLVRKDGKLVEQATPTSQLAGQAGLTAPPTTPAGVGALGGTAQQQAMAGSVAQKTSALRQSLDTSTTLGEAEADKRYRSAVTSEEQQKLDSQKRLGEVFGGTQQKVQDFISAEMQKQAAPAARLDTTGAVTVTDPAKQADVDATFSQIVSGVDTQKNIVKLMQLTGQTQEQIAAAAQDAAVKQTNATGGQAAASSLVDSSAINVSALLPTLGTTREELASLLGLDPTFIDKMSLTDLDEAVKASVNTGPASTAQVQAASQDANLGAAERASLREQSIEQSTTGQAASEAQLLDLGRSLENADTVAFGGKNYTIEELLSDENISKLVSDYLTNPASETSKQLQDDPNAAGLLSFINKYKQVLSDAATTVGTATAENTGIQKYNASLQNMVPGVKIPDSLLKGIYGDKWGSLQAAKLAPTGFIKTLAQLSPAERQQWSGPMSEFFQIAEQDPVVAKSLNKMTAQSMRKFFSPGTSGTTPFSDMMKARDTLAAVKHFKEENNIDALVNMYFGNNGGSAQVWNLVKENMKNHVLGKPYDPAINVFDPKHIGYIEPDAYANLFTKISNTLAKGTTPEGALAGKGKFTPVNPAGGLTDAELAAYHKTHPSTAGAYSAGGSTLEGAGKFNYDTWTNPFTGVTTTTPGMSDSQKAAMLAEAQKNNQGLPPPEKTINPFTGVLE